MKVEPLIFTLTALLNMYIAPAQPALSLSPALLLVKVELIIEELAPLIRIAPP